MAYRNGRVDKVKDKSIKRDIPSRYAGARPVKPLPSSFFEDASTKSFLHSLELSLSCAGEAITDQTEIGQLEVQTLVAERQHGGAGGES